MSNINHKPSRYMLNLQHVLETYADKSKGIINGLMEVNAGTINKYEFITESGQLKLDRVGYSSLAYPVSYGLIPQTWACRLPSAIDRVRFHRCPAGTTRGGLRSCARRSRRLRARFPRRPPVPPRRTRARRARCPRGSRTRSRWCRLRRPAARWY